MKTAFKKTFLKSLKKLRNEALRKSIADCIAQVESARSITELKNLKKLEGYTVHYRIRLGDYRIGLKIVDDIIYFVVLGHRKDIYKQFP